MCGVFGVMGKIPHKKEVLSHLSLLNMARGHHSTGFADINTETNEFVISKKPVDAVNFLPNLQRASRDCIIGHTRYATCGKINKQNAHPWAIGDIIGCHNGVVFNELDVSEYLYMNGDDISYEVDSQYLLHLMAYYGHLGNAQGMLNLTYWNTDESKLTLLAYGNPLCVAVSDEWDWIAWSSEQKHLLKVLHKKKIKDYKSYEMYDEVLKFTPGKTIDVVREDVPFDMDVREEDFFPDYSETYYETKF